MLVARMENVSKTFATAGEVVNALDGVSHQVSAGAFTCVYGASGSGKTTLLRVLAGMISSDSGEVWVRDHRMTAMTSSQRAAVRLHEIGFVFQSNNLLAELTAEENVALPLLARGLSWAQARSRTGLALNKVGVGNVSGRRPHQMSGGQRQRVGIARALAGEQPLLLADEPTGALDADNSRALFTLMRDLCDEHATSVVIATHDPLAREFADEVATMFDGRILSDAAAKR